jgi:hypothetical protein
MGGEGPEALAMELGGKNAEDTEGNNTTDGPNPADAPRVRRAKLYYLRERRGKSARIVENVNYKPLKA